MADETLIPIPRREDLRSSVRALCSEFPGRYWRELEETNSYPAAFVDALTAGGWLSVLIPPQFGGAGLGIGDAAAVLQEINRSGGNSSAAHAQLYLMGTLVRHGSEAQKRRYLPGIASGDLRFQAFGVTEPNAGSDTTRIETKAELRGSRYVINGQKVFISRAAHTDLMLLLARTSPQQQVTDKNRGLGLFVVDMNDAVARGQIVVRPMDMMINHSVTELFIQDLEVPVENVIGDDTEGFRYVLDSWNAERILIAAECVGDGDWFVSRASGYASTREVFGRLIGANQGVQFPIAHAYAQIRAAELMTYHAAALFDGGQGCGAEANMAKYLASQASWAAANACMDAHGGYGFAAEYDVERKFRETRLYSVAPVSNNLVLSYIAEHVLGLPRSY